MKDKQDRQVEENFKVFQKKLPELLKTHKGKFTLMRDGKIINFYDTVEKANEEGLSKYSDEIFSIQEVTNRVVDLGFHSHALCLY